MYTLLLRMGAFDPQWRSAVLFKRVLVEIPHMLAV